MRPLAAILATSGVLHFVRPETFESIVPRVLPAPRLLVYASGAVELLCAAGLARRRDWARTASAALLVAVFPANVQMALDAGSGRHHGMADNRALAWGRLPLQVLLVRSALRRPLG
jgi:uncharacterized membrane protein